MVMATSHVDVPLQLSRTELIRLHFHALGHLVEVAPWLQVPLADLSEWAGLMCSDTVLLELRPDGRVRATVDGRLGGVGYLSVSARADVVRDVELPSADGMAALKRLPVGELWRLESFEKPTSKGVS